MTLFIVTKKRQLEISDAYVMFFIFVLTYSATYLITKSIKRRFEKDKKLRERLLFSGGQQLQKEKLLELEAAQIILQCINNEEPYLVINPEIASLIRGMIKTGFMQHSYIISNRFARWLAIRLSSNSGGAIVILQNWFFFSENYVRLLTRSIFSVGVGTVTGLTAALMGSFLNSIPYAVLMMIAAFDGTANCGVNCDQHFRKLHSNQQPIEILVEREQNNLVIAPNNDEVEIFTPEPKQLQLPQTASSKTRKVKTKVYRSTGRRAKLVKFSEWRKTDPVLQTMANKFTPTEDAPYVPQRKCGLKNPQDLTGLE